MKNPPATVVGAASRLTGRGVGSVRNGTLPFTSAETRRTSPSPPPCGPEMGVWGALGQPAEASSASVSGLAFHSSSTKSRLGWSSLYRIYYIKLDYRNRVEAIPWDQYETAYGNAGRADPMSDSRPVDATCGSVGDQLLELASNDVSRALTASSRLWAGLCHQHAYLSSAGLPALPFLLEVLESVSEPVIVEILDILVGFAECSRGQSDQGWIGDIRARLVQERPRFAALASHDNPAIASMSQNLLDALDD